MAFFHTSGMPYHFKRHSKKPGYHGTFQNKYLVTTTLFKDPGYHGILKGTLKSLVTMALLPGYHGIISKQLHNKVQLVCVSNAVLQKTMVTGTPVTLHMQMI